MTISPVPLARLAACNASLGIFAVLNAFEIVYRARSISSSDAYFEYSYNLYVSISFAVMGSLIAKAFSTASGEKELVAAILRSGLATIKS